jgi:hypothetical protein
MNKEHGKSTVKTRGNYGEKWKLWFRRIKFNIYFYQNFITVSWRDENDKRWWGRVCKNDWRLFILRLNNSGLFHGEMSQQDSFDKN